MFNTFLSRCNGNEIFGPTQICVSKYNYTSTMVKSAKMTVTLKVALRKHNHWEHSILLSKKEEVAWPQNVRKKV